VNRWTDGLGYGHDDIWSRQDKWNITYCVSTASFGTAYSRVVSFMEKAAAGWENAADVRYVHVASEDGSCTTSNMNVKYNVVRQDWVLDKDGNIVLGKDGNPVPWIAGMSFPSEVRAKRQLIVGNSASWDDAFLLAVFIHEFGHSLGFRHEHIRVTQTLDNCIELDGKWRALTPYDNISAMHYPFCNGWGWPGYDKNFITEWDVEGAQSVYEAPTNVLNTYDGTVYARQRSTGDLYKHSASGWQKIGNPGQAFVTVSNTLYGQTPGRGSPVKYIPGSGWTTLGGPAGQIFNCGPSPSAVTGALCATVPSTGDLARYDAVTGSWTIIGGPGSRFRASQQKLFALTPRQDSTAMLGASGWVLVGDAAAELIGGGSNMYRLTFDRNWIQTYVEASSTWQTIGGTGRQFLASDVWVYGLRPDASYVMRYAGTSWYSIHGPAARMYGSYGHLYVTNPATESIDSYDPLTGYWTNLGKP
jgi:hypothetical protein